MSNLCSPSLQRLVRNYLDQCLLSQSNLSDTLSEPTTKKHECLAQQPKQKLNQMLLLNEHVPSRQSDTYDDFKRTVNIMRLERQRK